ncbi:MAG: hypothetical protein M0Z36_07920 [Thermaerobacter sp.]|nr:hypothetical protein [Thermaerobacter sp.]
MRDMLSGQPTLDPEALLQKLPVMRSGVVAETKGCLPQFFPVASRSPLSFRSTLATRPPWPIVTNGPTPLSDSKAINDQHGHATGDATLQVFGRRSTNMPETATSWGGWGTNALFVMPTALASADHVMSMHLYG